MKKILIILVVITILFIINQEKEEYVIIPKESIRFRIIPNSNNIEDLYIKEQVKNEISYIINQIGSQTNIESSRKSILENIPTIEEKIKLLFKNNNYNKKVNIKYGLNYFPEKTYKGVKYESGEYESIVIEIGNSSGDNYWCVLFPPLCMIDTTESDNVEYKFFVSEIINKFINN